MLLTKRQDLLDEMCSLKEHYMMVQVPQIETTVSLPSFNCVDLSNSICCSFAHVTILHFRVVAYKHVWRNGSAILDFEFSVYLWSVHVSTYTSILFVHTIGGKCPH